MAKKQAAPAAEAPEQPGEYPTTMYRKARVTDKTPNGYEARQFEDAEKAGAARAAGWVDSPDDLPAK